MSDTLTILAITDIHYANRSRQEAAAGAIMPLGLECTLRAIDEARRTCNPDVLVLLGDIVAEGSGPAGQAHLAEFAQALRNVALPVFVAPGDHDRDADAVLRAFNDHAGVHRVGNFLLYSFADPYAPDESMKRPRKAVEDFLAAPAAEPMIVLQHSPIYPPVPVPASEYPFMPLNAEEIMDSYRRRGVVLSLSGHYHAGQQLCEKDGTAYLTCAALAESPHPFYIIRLTGSRVDVERRTLRLEPPNAIVDGHVHTQFGYCAVDVHPEGVLERNQLLGVESVQFVEHAGQLYLTPDEFWHKVHIDDPQAIRRARVNGTDRVDAFRAALYPLRSDKVLVGLEVELDCEGNLTLLEEDRKDWDVLLGAIHWLPSRMSFRNERERLQKFWEFSEKLIASGIHVLAHPFRYPEQCKLGPPKDLYRPMAKALKACNVAAEVNFHIHAPDLEFYRVCAEGGVRIVLGSDSHLLREVADFWPHLRLLKDAGIPLPVGAWGAPVK